MYRRYQIPGMYDECCSYVSNATATIALIASYILKRPTEIPGTLAHWQELLDVVAQSSTDERSCVPERPLL